MKPTSSSKFPAQSLFSYDEAFSRNLGLVSKDEQDTLRRSTVAIAGLGGVGGIHLMTLARLGIGGFHISDGDTFSLANFNRQAGATVSTLDQPKAETMTRIVLEVNPGLRLKTLSEFITPINIDSFLDGVDIVIDAIDAYQVESRRLLINTALKRNIPVISAGPIGFSCSLLVFRPGGMNFDEYFDYDERLSNAEQFLKFMIGLTPRPYFLKYLKTEKVDFEKQTGPSLSSSVTLCAGFVAVEVLKLLLGRGKCRAVPSYHYFDPYLHIFKQGWLPMGNRNPLQKILFWYAKRRMGV